MRRALAAAALPFLILAVLFGLPFLSLVLPQPPGCQDGPCRWTTADAWTVLRAEAPMVVPVGAAILVVAIGVAVLRRLRRS